MTERNLSVRLVLAVVLPAGGGIAFGGTQIPVNATVTGQGNVQIGTINVADAPLGGGISATFTFAPGFGFLDDWYNFRWINVETGYTINGPQPPGCGGAGEPDCCCGAAGLPPCGPQVSDGNPMEAPLGTLPAIDPAPGPIPGGNAFNDASPFYFSDDEHADCNAMGFGVICVPNVSSSWSDRRADRGCDSSIDFATYLVAQNVTDNTADAPGLMDLCVLAGFEWTFTNMPESQVQTLSIVAPNAVDTGRINTALGNANPPGFAGWNAVTGCTFTECTYFTRCARWPRYLKSYTITSYKYTNYERNLEWEVLDEPVFVKGGTGEPVVMYFDVPFNPNDLHITYSWENSPFETHHWMWNKEKGDSFAWEWYCLKNATLDVFGCQSPSGLTELCQEPTNCIQGETCPLPYVPAPGDEVFGDLLGAGGTDTAVVGTLGVPAASGWGLIILSVGLLTVGSLVVMRRTGRVVSGAA